MTSPQNFCWLCVVALFLQPTSAGESPSASGKPLPAQDELLASRRVHPIALALGPSALAALRTNVDNHAYVRCAWRAGDLSLTNVGIHCKGDTAKQLVRGKPDFTITFDKFVRGQSFHRQKRLLLQSSDDDPSYLSAPIAFALFRQAGVPAPRCTFAHVALNGRDLGVYVIIEGQNRDFLRRHLRKDDGNLYDEGETHDVTGKLDKDQVSNGKDQSDVDDLVAVARVTDPGSRWQQVEQRLDMDRFLTFTAMEVLLWNEESYALAATQFRLYHDPATDRLVFFPKGVERVLEKTDGPAMPKCKGLVADAVLTTPEGARRYRETVAHLLNDVFVPDKVQALARDIAATIRPVVVGAAAAAGRTFDAAVTRFQEAVARRAAFVTAQIRTSNSNQEPGR